MDTSPASTPPASNRSAASDAAMHRERRYTDPRRIGPKTYDTTTFIKSLSAGLVVSTVLYNMLAHSKFSYICSFLPPLS